MSQLGSTIMLQTGCRGRVCHSLFDSLPANTCKSLAWRSLHPAARASHLQLLIPNCQCLFIEPLIPTSELVVPTPTCTRGPDQKAAAHRTIGTHFLAKLIHRAVNVLSRRLWDSQSIPVYGWPRARHSWAHPNNPRSLTSYLTENAVSRKA